MADSTESNVHGVRISQRRSAGTELQEHAGIGDSNDRILMSTNGESEILKVIDGIKFRSKKVNVKTGKKKKMQVQKIRRSVQIHLFRNRNMKYVLKLDLKQILKGFNPSPVFNPFIINFIKK